MASNPFTLAALATTAVPGISIVGAVDDGSDAERDVVALTTAEGETLRAFVPRTPGALSGWLSESRALQALTAGARERLPFSVPSALGEAAIQRTSVVVTTRLGGVPARLDDISPRHPGFPAAVGNAIAAIHSLPTSIIADAGLSHRSVSEIRDDLFTIFDRAAATGHVPKELLQRWEEAAEDRELWQFKPVVVHGDMQPAALHRDQDSVAGITNWHALALGDPARDLYFLLGSEQFASVDAAFAAYTDARGGADRQLRRRAMLHAELEIAKWLLHGVDSADAEIVADARGMLAGLVDRVDGDESVAITAERFETMDLQDVKELLQRSESQGTRATGPVESGFEFEDAETQWPQAAPAQRASAPDSAPADAVETAVIAPLDETRGSDGNHTNDDDRARDGEDETRRP
ncbi:phosphotransferase [Humidisolicoccus flavus]|uniref:phosphotransferase n=1 Tax=Humidisolicoccus flavus TaxID=3111414 RepID=UPI003245B851